MDTNFILEEKSMFDVVIIGSGPAGISAAIYLKRAKKNNDSYAYEDGVTEIYHHELARLQSINTEMSLRMQAAIEKLPEKQKIRLIKYYYNAMNASQIAREEGVSSQAVDKSIASAIEKLKKFLR